MAKHKKKADKKAAKAARKLARKQAATLPSTLPPDDGIRRTFEAAQPSNYHKTPTTLYSADLVMRLGGLALLRWARHLDENHDLVIGVLDELVNNIVGHSLQVVPTVTGRGGKLLKKVNRDIARYWKAFCKRPEVTRCFDWNEMCRQACRAWLRDGDIFGQHVAGNVPGLTHASPVAYSLELLEAEMVPHDLNDEGANVVQGVQLNAWRQPVAFEVHKTHPGSNGYHLARTDDTKSVPADRLLHLKFTRRPNQVRGQTILHGVLLRLNSIKDYEESELVAARVAAALTGYIKKPDNGNYTAGDARELSMEPGMIFDTLLPGEEVGTISSDRPNSNLGTFRDDMLRAISAGTGAKFSTIARNYNGTYSAQRQELVETWPAYLRLRSLFSEQFVWPVYREFVQMLQLQGLVQIPPTADPLSLDTFELRGPAMPWIDVFKEVQAAEKEVANGFKSKSQVIRDRGGDPDLVREQIEQERAADPQLQAAPAADAPPDNDQDQEPETDDEAAA